MSTWADVAAGPGPTRGGRGQGRGRRGTRGGRGRGRGGSSSWPVVQHAAAAIETVMTLPLPSTPDQQPDGKAFGSWIRVKVGTGRHTATYEIHRGLLGFYSGYFQVAIRNVEQGRFSESLDGTISLPDEENKVFDAFKDWLYTKALPDAPALDQSFLFSLHCHMLCLLWCFGDRREIPALQNECVNRLINDMGVFNIVATDQIRFIYENTLDGSPLRRCIIAVVTGIQVTDLLKGESADDWCEQSLLDLARVLLEQPSHETWAAMIRKQCDWHVHEDGVKCVGVSDPW
ncbi:uncharacterized protein RCC_10645 [Ramularia collo-cygni]|uniref:BTB domain-containing protein n=1 Tax=Ramularia collo-cygni TaxID=112498 RepID=A0A2D3V3Q8_9PEZI|nr:uncharacterized protein RCC_10645 [Ramularia collo-cygni]CZT24917.1 uncharacterized protein RCC_10645 [Ramularia collo-cygni]